MRPTLCEKRPTLYEREAVKTNITVDMSIEMYIKRNVSIWKRSTLCQKRPVYMEKDLWKQDFCWYVNRNVYEKQREYIKSDLLYVKRDMCIWKEACENEISEDISIEIYIKSCTYFDVHYWHVNRDLVFEKRPPLYENRPQNGKVYILWGTLLTWQSSYMKRDLFI